jgi:catechol 2,3-dioxygenase-like lactoylglutathione lyase family enzyme
MDMKLEVVPIPVRDVDAAKDFYTRQVGFGLDHDVRPNENMRVVQMTPPGSACSVVIGEGLPLGEPGSVKAVQLVVEDLAAIRSDPPGGAFASATCSRWDPKARPAHATASSKTRTQTCGRSRNTRAPKHSQPGSAPAAEPDEPARRSTCSARH